MVLPVDISGAPSFTGGSASASSDLYAAMNAPFTIGGSNENKLNYNTLILAGTALIGGFIWLKMK